MGRDIHVRVAILNKETNIYEEIKLYRKEKDQFRPVAVYDGRSYELFGILDGEDDDFPYGYIRTNYLSEELKEEIEKYKNTEGYYDFFEVNLADAKIYLKENPKVRDYEHDGEWEAWKDNPVKHFIEAVCHYINIHDGELTWWCKDSDVKILYWFDC